MTRFFQFRLNLYSTSGRELYDEYLSAVRSLRQELNNPDFAKIRKSCDEISAHILLQRLGLRAYVGHIATTQKIELSADELAAIQEMMCRHEKHFFEQAKLTYDQFLHRVATMLPKHGSFADDVQPSSLLVTIDVLLADADQFDEFDENTLPTRPGLEELKALLAPTRQFALNEAGNWQRLELVNVSTFQKLISFLKNAPEGEKALWNEERTNAMLVHFNRFQEEVNRLARQLTSVREYVNLREAVMKLEDKYLTTIWLSEILDDPARLWLIHGLRQKEVRTYGVPGMLLSLETRHGQPISEDERKKMRDTLKSEVATLKSELLEQYVQTTSDQIAGLPESIRQQVTDSLGARPEYLLPNLTLLSDRVQPPKEPHAEKR